MLAPPTTGMYRSVKAHNVSFDALCDWIEGSALFDEYEDTLSAPDIVDVLIESEVYTKQELAWEIVSAAWAELKRRLSWIKEASPIEIATLRLKRLRAWREAPAHSFCIVLSYAKWYPDWAGQFGRDYNKQGELFEKLTKEAMEKLFPEWVVHQTGWTQTHTSRLGEIVKEITNLLGEAPGDVEHWTNDKAHEAGLDLLCYRPFSDGRVGVPVYLMQCGSGGKWEEKLHTPNLRIWTKIVQFASDPKKAFAMPYALSDEEFRRSCNLVDGLLLDRYRLLSPGRDNADWLSPELKNAMLAWLAPRIERLPRADE